MTNRAQLNVEPPLHGPGAQNFFTTLLCTDPGAVRQRRKKFLGTGRSIPRVGESILAYWLVALITGAYCGEHYGQPKAVLVAAAEDSWEHTIVPRLMAAGADLDLVYRIEVITNVNVHSEITMPTTCTILKSRRPKSARCCSIR